MTGTGSKIVFRPLPLDDPKQRQPNILRVKTKLGWEPEVCLEEGIKRTIDYFKKVLG